MSSFNRFFFLSFLMLFAINCTSSTDDETSQAPVKGILQDMVVLILLDEISETVTQSLKDDC